jgi:hypothetical protein
MLLAIMCMVQYQPCTACLPFLRLIRSVSCGGLNQAVRSPSDRLQSFGYILDTFVSYSLYISGLSCVWMVRSAVRTYWAPYGNII